MQAALLPIPEGDLQFGLYHTGELPHQLGKGRFEYALSNGRREVLQGYQLPLRRWFHYAATFDGVLVKVFVDGKEVASRRASASTLMNSDKSMPLMFGHDGEGHISALVDMDSTRVWSKMRNPHELREGMHSIIAPDEPGLVAGWDMGEGIKDPHAARFVDFTKNGRVVDFNEAQPCP